MATKIIYVTKVYKFGGLRWIREDGTTSQEPPTAVLDAFYKYGWAYNELVMVHQEGRERYRQTRSKMIPGYARAEERLTDLYEQRGRLKEEIEDGRQAARKRVTMTPAQTKLLAKLNDQIKKAKVVMEAEKEKVEKNKAFQKQVLEINAEKKDQINTQSRGMDLLRTTKNLVKAAVSQAAVRSKVDVGRHHFPHGANARMGVEFEAPPLTPEGRERFLTCKKMYEARKIKKEAFDAMCDRLPRSKPRFTAAEMFATNTKFMLERPRQRVREDGQESSRRHPSRGWMAIKADGETVRAEFTVILHRDIPDDAVVAGAVITRRRFGTAYQHTLCITATVPVLVEPAPQAEVAVLQTWERGENREVIVARCYDGSRSWNYVLPKRLVQSIKHGPLMVDAIDRLFHAESNRQLQDKEIDRMKKVIIAFREGGGGERWWRDATKDVGKWRDPTRLTRLHDAWRGQVQEGEEVVVDQLRAWRQQNAHLYSWQVQEQRGALDARNHQYALWADELTRMYGRVIVRTMEPSEYERPSFGEKDGRKAALADFRVKVSPSSLVEAIRNSCRNRGRETVEVRLRGERSPEALLRAAAAQEVARAA